MAALDAALPATWSRGNPVDIVGDAGPARYTHALDVLLEDADYDVNSWSGPI
jgi:acetyltransferase